MEDYSQTPPETQITTRRMPSLSQHWTFQNKPEILVFMHLPIYQGWQPFPKIYNSGQANMLETRKNASGSSIWPAAYKAMPSIRQS